MADYKAAAILACAGSGSRMRGTCENKLLISDGDTPIVAYAIKAYEETDGIGLVVVVTQKALFPVFQEIIQKYGFHKTVLAEGGATRMESVLNGARAVPECYDLLAIGDGARPLIRPEEIQKTLEAAHKSGAAALGVHLTDTVKEVEGENIARTIPRERLVGIQTPQVFDRTSYLELAEKAAVSGEIFTDDASIFEYFGRTVTFVEGRRDNMKITLPEDVPLLRALMEARRCE